MKLFKQIWISILILMVVVFLGATYINLHNSQTYLEEQLFAKNLDNANALSGMLAASKGNEEIIKLTVQAYFDLGHYQEISFTKPDGAMLAHLVYTNQTGSSRVPAWFEALTNIKSRPGIAEVSSGWRQLGQLTIVSNNSDAYMSLWQSFQQTILWFLFTFIAFGLFSYYFFNYLTKTLSAVVNQANAISERRFILSPVPKTHELKQLVNTMNRTSKRVRKILTKDTQRIESLRNETQRDKLTGLINRDFFIQSLSLEMKPSHELYQGAIVLIRLEGLDDFNQAHGWESTDRAILKLSDVLKDIAANEKNILLSRIGGGNFAVAIPAWSKPQIIENIIRDAWSQSTREEPLYETLNLRLGYARLVPGLEIHHLIENSMSKALSFGDTWVTANSVIESESHDIKTWSRIITEALQKQRLSYDLYKVLNVNFKPIHFEASVKFKSELSDHMFNAGSFLPWAIRTKQIILIDTEIVKQAFAQIIHDEISIAVNLDIHSLSDNHFISTLEGLLRSNPGFAKYLNLEVPAKFIFDNHTIFNNFCERVIPQGIKVGIDNIGLEVSDFSKIKNLGIHYIKIHPALINQFVTNADNSPTLANLLLISRSMGYAVIANGVTQADQIQLLIDFGFDGFTGPAIGV